MPAEAVFFNDDHIVFLQEHLDEAALTAFALVTYLGDIAVYILLLSILYWYTDRTRGSLFIALALLSLATGLFAKELFALDRPPQDLWVVEEMGPGLPSVHAVSAVVVYGALASRLRVATVRIRWLVAGVVVAAVAVSRVVLGVHYLGDVVAGLALGAVVLWLGLTHLDDRISGLFLAATVFALLAAVLSGGAYYPSALAAGAVGASIGWLLSRDVEAIPPKLVAMAALAILAVLRLFPGAEGEPMVSVVLANFGVGFIVLATPLAMTIRRPD